MGFTDSRIKILRYFQRDLKIGLNLGQAEFPLNNRPKRADHPLNRDVYRVPIIIKIGRSRFGTNRKRQKTRNSYKYRKKNI